MTPLEPRKGPAFWCGLLIFGVLFAQFSAAQRPLVRKTEGTLQLNFPNTPVSAILPYYEKLTGKKIIRDGNLEGINVSITSDSKLTKEEAIRFIDSALLLNGYAILPFDDSTLKIINYTAGKSIRAQELPVITDPSQIPVSDQVVNYVMTLSYVTPEEAIATFSQIVTLNPYGAMTPLENANAIAITENTSLIRTLINFKNHVDIPPNNVIHQFVRLERADAERVAEIINGIIEKRIEVQKRQSSILPPASNVTKTAGKTPRSATGNLKPSVRNPVDDVGISIVPYERTNSILVVAPPSDFAYMKELIQSFDEPGDNVNFMKRKLHYVSVLDYMSSFYNALARGTDISEPEGLLESTGTSINTGLGNNQLTSLSRAPDIGGTNGNAASRDILGSPDEVGVPVSYMVGNTLLIGDPRANSLIVSGSPENIKTIERLIDEIDVQPMQVYLSTIIGQLTIGDDMNYSLNALQSLSTFNTPSGNKLSGAGSLFQGPDPTPNVGGLTSHGNFPAFGGLSLYGKFLWGKNNASASSMLRLFAKDSRFKILSRPSLYAQNNVKAVISSGQRIAIPTSTLTSAGGFNNGFAGAITSNIEFRDVVLKLEVIPLINSENEVTLKIAQVNDNIVGSQTISGNQIPTLSTQQLVTTVTLKNGETMVLGGLITERADQEVTGLPGVRRIPFLGRALGSTSIKESREEMLIFIQPHIINGVSPTPNDLERCRNSVMPEALAFGDPFPPHCELPRCETKNPNPESSSFKQRPFRFSSARKASPTVIAVPVETPKRFGFLKFRMKSKK